MKRSRKKLACRKPSLGWLSEASRVFDAEPLKESIRQLGEQVSTIPKSVQLSQLSQKITLINGTIISALPRIVQASLLKRTAGSGWVQWRLHTHFEVDRYVPTSPAC